MSTGAIRNIVTRVSPVLRGPAVSQRASLYTKPPLHPLTFPETVIGLLAFATAILGPSGYILAHIENYKHRD